MENLQFAGKFYILISDIAHDSHIVEHSVEHSVKYSVKHSVKLALHF
jgi:hypothetical protein